MWKTSTNRNSALFVSAITEDGEQRFININSVNMVVCDEKDPSKHLVYFGSFVPNQCYLKAGETEYFDFPSCVVEVVPAFTLANLQTKPPEILNE